MQGGRLGFQYPLGLTTLLAIPRPHDIPLIMQQRNAVPSDDELMEASADAFRIAAGKAIGDFDCAVLPAEPKQIRIQITIYGHIEVPTRQQFFQQVKQVKRIAFKCGERRLVFRFQDSCDKNSNDYCLFYIAKL